MHHWIIDRDVAALPSWLEAFPQATLVRRDQIAIVGTEPAILWFRLHAGEAAASFLPTTPVGAGQFVVVLADEPDESVVTAALASGASGVAIPMRPPKCSDRSRWLLKTADCGSASLFCNGWSGAPRISSANNHHSKKMKPGQPRYPSERRRWHALLLAGRATRKSRGSFSSRKEPSRRTSPPFSKNSDCAIASSSH